MLENGLLCRINRAAGLLSRSDLLYFQFFRCQR